MNLSDVIEGLVEERGLDRDKVEAIVCDGIQAAYNKRFPGVVFQVSYNKKTGNVDVFAEKDVVHNVEEEDFQISLRKAKQLDPNAEIGQMMLVPFEDPIGRIEILTAKQMIASKIRDLEQLAVFNEFSEKKGTLITGTVHKRERAGYAVKVGDILALLPNENIIPQEPIRVGHPIRALLLDVFAVAHGDYQLILDRATPEFVQRLLEIEIPEVYEGLVEIKKVVRIPGYKTKVIVSSNRKEIDPVGTCVGVGGARIKPILREIGQEKVDLIQATDSLERLVKFSLKPAEIDKVDVVDSSKVIVWLAPDQRSYAIGKMGQNISLAARLSGVEIQLQDIAAAQADVKLDTESIDSDYEQPQDYDDAE